MAFKIGNWEPAKTFQEMIKDPMRAARAVSTVGVSEAPRAAGKQGWEQTLQVGPPGGKTPTIADITNPYAEAAKMATGEISGMLPQYKQLYGTGAGALTGLIGDLQAQAKGQAGPGMSLGQALLQQGLTQNIGAVQSQLASQRGLSPALRARMAAQQTAAMQGQTAQQAGILGLQQQLAAQQQLGQLGTGAAQLGSESQLRGAGLLTGSSQELEKMRQNIAAANQAAAIQDKARTVGAVTSVLGAGAQVGAAYAGRPTPAATPAATPTVGAAHGGRIDGVAPYAGDTPKNDVVPANLSPGEIVIPRSAAGSKKEAKKFIDALDDWDEEPSYGKVLKARQKKNYADGGMIPNDEQMMQEAGQAYLEKQRAPYPMVEKAKGAFDEFLTNRVVEPLAQRGYPTLGAALATVPSTAMEALVPSTPDDLMASMLPLRNIQKSPIQAMPGAKLSREASQAIKTNKAIELLEQLRADDVDILKLPKKSEFKKFEKQYLEAKKVQASGERIEKESELWNDNQSRIKELYSSLFGSDENAPKKAMNIFEKAEYEANPYNTIVKLAENNSDIKEIAKALKDFNTAIPLSGGMTVKGRMGAIAKQQKLSDLIDALEANQSKLALTGQATIPENVSKFPGKK